MGKKLCDIQNAFALVNFTGTRILEKALSRNYFGENDSLKELVAGKTDAEILRELDCDCTEISRAKLTASQLPLIIAAVNNYQILVCRLQGKLNDYSATLAVKIVEDKFAGDFSRIENLNQRYGRAKTILKKLFIIGDDARNLRNILNALSTKNDKLIEKFYRLEFAKRLKQKRVKAKLTQQDLANFTGLTKTDVSRYENGNKLPAFMTLVRLTKALGCTADELIFGE